MLRDGGRKKDKNRMENKILELVKEVNSDQEVSIFDYVDNGFTKGVKLNSAFVFDDDNYSTEFVRQISLSKACKLLSEQLEHLSPMLGNELNLFFAEKDKKLKEIYPKARLKWNRKTLAVYTLYVSGAYEEEGIDCFMDVLKGDFEYIFDGFKLECEW
jgi:hypothetical protein